MNSIDEKDLKNEQDLKFKYKDNEILYEYYKKLGYNPNESIALAVFTYGDYTASEKEPNTVQNMVYPVPTNGLYVVANEYYNKDWKDREPNVADYIGKVMFESIESTEYSVYVEDALEHSTQLKDYIDLLNKFDRGEIDEFPTRLSAGYDTNDYEELIRLCKDKKSFDEWFEPSDDNEKDEDKERSIFLHESDIFNSDLTELNTILIAGGSERKFIQAGILSVLRMPRLLKTVSIIVPGYRYMETDINGIYETLFSNSKNIAINQLFNLAEETEPHTVDSMVRLLKDPKTTDNEIKVLYGYDSETEDSHEFKSFIRSIYESDAVYAKMLKYDTSRTALIENDELKSTIRDTLDGIKYVDIHEDFFSYWEWDSDETFGIEGIGCE